MKKIICLFLILMLVSIVGHAGGKQEIDAKYSVRFAAGDGGSSYQTAGAILATEWNNFFDDKFLMVIFKPSDGSAFNVLEMRKGELDMTLAPSNIVYDIQHQKGLFQYNSYPGVRLLMPLWPEISQFIAKGRNRTLSIKGLKRKKINMGATGSRSEYNALIFLKEIGNLSIDQIYLRHSTNDTILTQFQNDNIDVIYLEAGIPTASVTNILSTVANSYVLSIDQKGFDLVSKKYQGYGFFEIPPRTYPSQRERITSIGTKLLLVVDENLSYEIVYGLIKNIIENLDDYKSKYIGFEQITIDDLFSNVPDIYMHPAAVQYLTEANIDVPKRLIISDKAEESKDTKRSIIEAKESK